MELFLNVIQIGCIYPWASQQLVHFMILKEPNQLWDWPHKRCFWQWRCLHLHRASPCAIDQIGLVMLPSELCRHTFRLSLFVLGLMRTARRSNMHVYKEAWAVKGLHFSEANFASIWVLLLDYYLLGHKCFCIKSWCGIQTASIVYFDLFVDHRTLPALALPFNKHKFCPPLNATPWLLSSWSQVFLHRK